MEKEPRKLVLGATPFIICLLVLTSFFYIDFLGFNINITVSHWMVNLSTKKVDHGVDEHESVKFLLRRLLRGEDRTKLDATGFACDSAPHSLVCIANKAVRIDTNTTTVHILSNQNTPRGQITIRPYPRQEDLDVLNRITPVHILYGHTTPPICHYTHNVPAVIFSSSGLTGNLFHDFNEIIIPLFITLRHFQSHVQLMVVDYKPSFVLRYKRIISHLSRYEVINSAENGSVHCFAGVVVGLKFHNNVALNSSGKNAMLDFKRFLRESFDVKIKNVMEIERPILVLVSHQKTRTFFNEDEIVAMMEGLGFQVIIATNKITSNLENFAKLVSSCTVMVRAYGTGLANELFLPAGAVVVEVVPLGLEWASSAYIGEPAGEMGVHYLEYKIEPEESMYGRDHHVIDGQYMKIRLGRFRETLVEALSLLSLSIPLR